ncbi:macro domain-containing protein [Hydrogenovibrio sp. JE_KL2]|uniref:type II toxin-antitoxin system antitoxin DNA ADP-ribosyl glycohydrolase DarG n=1 Tax=Hydrogenovibrio sp. JE_KL2 TaxID=2651188 RepID=UPI00128CA824|nr:macro domain-containing protein [Hydrogenovibrio sp. JE_KL2]MPQ76661.1 macro domain-containing protein [Hydrogenovibrio sp. JE_KL2]
MTLIFKKGDLFESHDEAIVNTVNCVGVMGKGIALQYKNLFPENYVEYKKQCSLNSVVPGKMFVYEYKTEDLFSKGKPKFIINFPTKDHWRAKSRVEYVEKGLDDLIFVIKEKNIKSISMPAIGCGNGGLDWSNVKEIVSEKLASLDNVIIHVYEPKDYFEPEYLGQDNIWTVPRAILVRLFGQLQESFGGRITHLSMQKIVYFLQEFGVDYKVSFSESDFGPYSEELKMHFMTLNLKKYLKGFDEQREQGKTRSIEISAHSFAEAGEFLDSSEEYKTSVELIEKIENLIAGFESPLGMELISTVHLCAKKIQSDDVNSIYECIEKWSPKKLERFSFSNIEIATQRLHKLGCI